MIKNYIETVSNGKKRIACQDKPKYMWSAKGYKSIDEEYADIELDSTPKEKKLAFDKLIKNFSESRIQGIEVEFDTDDIEVEAFGRNDKIRQAELNAGLKYERELVWIDGAENITGTIILPHDDYDKVYVVKGTSENPEIIFINDDPSVRPYYEKKDGKTYIYVTGFSGGGGTQSDPYLVSNSTDLDNVRNNLAAYYKQNADIDMSTFGSWTPIGTSKNPFTGDYDGGNFKISDLTIGSATIGNGKYLGLFACLSGSRNQEIKNINIINFNIVSNYDISRVGGIAGYIINNSNYVSIHNCYVELTVEATSINGTTGFPYEASYAGGIVGHSYRALIKIENCETKFNTIKFATGCIGGIVGRIDMYYPTNNIYIKRCKSNVNFSSDLSYAAIHTGSYKGGILGDFNRNTVNTELIYFKIEDCYSVGNISGYYNIGGIIGEIEDTTRYNYVYITKCYSSCELKGLGQTGGIVGYIYGLKAYINITYNFALMAKITRTVDSSYNTFGRILGENNNVDNCVMNYNYALDTMQFIQETL